MRAIEQRLTKLEASTEATEQPQSAVIIFDGVTGQELTERPASASVLVFLPDNGRNDRQ